MDPILAHISDVTGLFAVLIAFFVMRHGSGQADRQFKEKVESAIQNFAAVLDEKLDARFKGYMDKDYLEIRLKLIETSVANNTEIHRLTNASLDHRITRDAEHIAMMMKVLFEHGIMGKDLVKRSV